MLNKLYLLLFVVVLWKGYHHFIAPSPTAAVPTVESDTIPVKRRAKETYSAGDSPRFVCDGRTHCSQMTSRDEAVFFIKNCPNTRMDGDNDGNPCEQQFDHW